MSLDVNKKDGYFIDQYGMITETDAFGEGQDLKSTHGDCIQKTLDAYISYDYLPFVEAVRNCFIYKTDKKGKYLQGYRHPYWFDESYNTMSRDHIINSLILFKLSKSEFYLNELNDNLRWKISDKYTFTIDSWLWMKGISGNKFKMFLYYLIDIPFLFLCLLWNKLAYKLGNVSDELPQDVFNTHTYPEPTKKEAKWRKLVYPIYSIYLKAFMFYASPNSMCKKISSKLCLKMTDKQNILLRILFGDKNVTEEEVLSYKSMSFNRWSTSLNELEDRGCRIRTEPYYLDANVIDVDLLRKIWDKFN